MSHSILLGSLGPDVAQLKFGMTIWDANNYVGTWGFGSPRATAAPGILGGYAAAQDEKFKQITVVASQAPAKPVTLTVWLKPVGFYDWYKTKHNFVIDEEVTHKVASIDLELGDRIVFELEGEAWELGQGGLSIYGVKD